MSALSDIRRAMRPAEMEPWEDKALFDAIRRSLPHAGSQDWIAVPGVTKAGKAYLLRLRVLAGVIDRFEVDHAPAMDSPEMCAYLERRAEWEVERGRPYGEDSASPSAPSQGAGR